MPKILLWSLIVLVAFSNVFSPLVANAGETDSSLRDIADIFIRDPFIRQGFGRMRTSGRRKSTRIAASITSWAPSA